MTTEDHVREAFAHMVAPFEKQPDGWQDVLQRAGEPTRQRRTHGRCTSRPGRLLVLAAAVGALSGASLLGFSFLGSDVSVLERARAAVTISSGQVLHARIVTTTMSGRVLGTTEEWIQGAPPHEYRVVFEARGESRVEQAGTLDQRALHSDVYDARSNTIQRSERFGWSTRLPFDPAAAIRAALAERHAHVAGRRLVDGKLAVVVELTSLVSDGAGWAVGPGGTGKARVFVDPETFAPIEIEFENLSGLGAVFGTPEFGGALRLIERFPIFQRLPATAGALRLTSLAAQHPGARCLLVPVALKQPCAPAK
jgi:hypothetical protein